MPANPYQPAELEVTCFQAEAQKAELAKHKRDAETERALAREETAVLQQDVMRLLGEKQALESSERNLQELLQRLEEELSALQREKDAEAMEQHSQVGEPPVLSSSHHWGSCVRPINVFQHRLAQRRTKRRFRSASAASPEGLAVSFTSHPGHHVNSSVP